MKTISGFVFFTLVLTLFDDDIRAEFPQETHRLLGRRQTEAGSSSNRRGNHVSDRLKITFSPSSEPSQSHVTSGFYSNLSSTGSDVKRRHNNYASALESSLLHIFGMTSKPRLVSGRYVPQFMVDLYYQRYDQNGGRANDVTTRKKRQTHPKANTVRSFYCEDISMLVHDHRLELRLFFNISEISSSEALIGTELLISLPPSSPPPSSTSSSSSSSSASFSSSNTFEAPPPVVMNKTPEVHRRQRRKIDVYMVTEGQQTSNGSSLIGVRSLASKLVRSSCYSSCWETFNVTKAVRLWRQTSRSNLGLRIVITDGGKTPPKRGRKNHLGLVVDKDALEKPLLVVYTDDGKGMETTRGRISRDPVLGRGKPFSSSSSRGRHRKRSSLTGGIKTAKGGGGKKTSKCRRWPLYVDFSEVGWKDWLIAPAGYHAYFCQGECPYYLPDNLNSTNHAVVQTLVHSIDPQAVPKPCCVPTELRPISLLYIDNSEKVVIKNYQDMIVEACGCR